MFTKSVVAHMELAARREPPGEGEDPVGVHFITFWPQMALPMSYIYTLNLTAVVKVSLSCFQMFVGQSLHVDV